MNSPHTTAPSATWVCPLDGNRRDVPSAHVGSGAPACPVCKNAMVPVQPERVTEARIIPGLAEALTRLDPELQQEPEA